MANESLFTSQTPGIPDINEGVPVTVANALKFTPATGKVKGFRMYKPATTGAGTFAGVLWDVANPGAPLGAATFGALSVGWNEVLLPVAIDVDNVHVYKVGLRTSEGRYAATAAFWSLADLVSGNITGLKDGTGGVANGSFTSGLVNYPSSTFNSNGYFIDVIYEAGGGESHPVAVTGTIGISGTAVTAGTHTVAPTGSIGIMGTATHSGGDGGGLQEGAAYDLQAIMEALAGVFNGVQTGDQIGGVPVTLECHPEVVGQLQPPSLVLELDDLQWDINMAAGADTWTVVALAMVAEQDMEGAQQALWRFLSRKNTSGVMRLKAALLADQTLGGLVSYAIMTNVRNIGVITFNGVDYLGAELIIEMVS